MEADDYCVRTDWAGINKGRQGCSAINTAEEAKVDSRYRARQRTGAAWYSRNSVMSNCSMMDGAPRRIIHALHPA
jgi:hypothetical protein